MRCRANPVAREGGAYLLRTRDSRSSPASPIKQPDCAAPPRHEHATRTEGKGALCVPSSAVDDGAWEIMGLQALQQKLTEPVDGTPSGKVHRSEAAIHRQTADVVAGAVAVLGWPSATVGSTLGSAETPRMPADSSLADDSPRVPAAAGETPSSAARVATKAAAGSKGRRSSSSPRGRPLVQLRHEHACPRRSHGMWRRRGPTGFAGRSSRHLPQTTTAR